MKSISKKFDFPNNFFKIKDLKEKLRSSKL